MNQYKKLFSDTVILGLGTFGSKLLVFLLMPLYTALLTTDQYGTAELITGTANLLIPLACVGIGNGIFRFAADKAANKSEVLSSGMLLLACGLAGFLLLSPLLGLVEYFDGYLWLIVLYVIFANIQSVCAQYVRAIDRTRLFAVQGILNTVLTILFNVLFLMLWDLGVTGYVLSVIVGNILTTVFLFVAARLWRELKLSYVKKETVKELLWFSLPMIPTTVCWLITDLSDRYMVTYFCGDHINGIYSAAYKIPTVVNLISGIFMQAWQFSAVAQSSDEETCKDFYSKVFDGFLSVIMIGSASLIVLSRFLSGLLLHADYSEAWRYMPVLLCSAALEAIVSFLATVYMVRKKSMHSFYTAMLGSVLNILLNLILIPRIGAMGAAIATLASYCAVMIARLIDAPRIISFKLRLVRLIYSSLLILLAAGAMIVGGEQGIYLALTLALVVFGINVFPLLKSLKRLLCARRSA